MPRITELPTSIRGLWERNEIHGIELLFDTCVIALRAVSISYWLKDEILPIYLGRNKVSDPTMRRVWRDNLIDGYCVFQFVLLLLALFCQTRFLTLSSYIAGYIVFEIYLNLFSIFFVPRQGAIGPPAPGEQGKINEPSTSAERSILLLFCNILQIVISFSVFYRTSVPSLSIGDSFRDSVLVFGTLGASNLPSELVVIQIALDFWLVVMALGAVVGKVGGFAKN